MTIEEVLSLLILDGYAATQAVVRASLQAQGIRDVHFGNPPVFQHHSWDTPPRQASGFAIAAHRLENKIRFLPKISRKDQSYDTLERPGSYYWAVRNWIIISDAEILDIQEKGLQNHWF